MTREDIELWNIFTKTLFNVVFRTPAYEAVRKSREYTLDLHGMKIGDAHHLTKQFIRRARNEGKKFITIITGLSGSIRQEFPDWMELNPLVKRVESLNGGGAFKVFMK